MAKHILDVSYYSQHLDVEEESWRPRSCGVLCLKMLMGFYGRDKKNIMELINAGVDRGGYSSHGWRHDVLVEMAREEGLSAFRMEYKDDEKNGLKDILDFLKKGYPVMVSAVKNFSEKNKFHLVLLTGLEEDKNNLKGFYYNDPDSMGKEEGKDKFVPIETFKRYWRKMAIYVNI